MAVSSGIARRAEPLPYPDLSSRNDFGSLWRDTLEKHCGVTLRALCCSCCMWQELYDIREHIMEGRTGEPEVKSCGCQCCLYGLSGAFSPNCPLSECLILSHKNTFYSAIDGSKYSSGLTTDPLNTSDSYSASVEGLSVYLCTWLYLAREWIRANNEKTLYRNGTLKLRPEERPPETANSMR